jgi:AAA15 family ATPase/GTPase
MYLSAIRVFNYKSFIDSGTKELKPDINVIVGQNNAGKSALLEALTLNFRSVRHESLVIKPKKETVVNEASIATFQITINSQELKEILRLQNALAFAVPKTFVINELELFLINSGKAPNKLLNFSNSQLAKEHNLVGTYDSIEQKVSELFLQIDDMEGLPNQ